MVRPPPRDFAVMVCTRDRPLCLRGALAAIADLQSLPSGRIDVVVADNDPQGAHFAIAEAAAAAGLTIHYVHEPQRGYSSIRNAAIQAALQTPAEILLFVDDDWRCPPDLVAHYAAAFARHDADVLQGNTTDDTGKPKGEGTDGRPVRKAVGTYNVAFRRWLVEGAGIRFDPRLDLIGFEDREFFLAAERAKAAIRQAEFAAVSPAPADQLDRIAQRDLKTFAEAAACNKIALETMLHGRHAAVWWYVRSYLARGLAGSVASAVLVLARHLGLPAARLEAATDLMRRKHRGAWKGLVSGRGYDRAAARAGELIEVELAASRR